MTMINAKALDRKSGGAQWRDLQFFPRNRSSRLVTRIESEREFLAGFRNLQ
jgi:hypothetical protein